MHQAGCHMGDLRLIDCSYPRHPTAFVARDGAVIVSVASVKALVRAHEVLLFEHAEDEFVRQDGSLVGLAASLRECVACSAV